MRTLALVRILKMACAGAAGGLVAFLLMEPSLSAAEMERQFGIVPNAGDAITAVMTQAVMFGLVLGLAIGVALVTAEEAPSGRPIRLIRAIALAAAAGTACGAVGGVVGQVAFSMLLLMGGALLGLPGIIVARTVGWCLVGAAAGICPGVVSRSLVRVRQGALGGVLGGSAGGLCFDMLGLITQGGSTSRAVGTMLMGAAIGAAVCTVEELSKQYWVTMLSGSREGRSYILAKETTEVGRDELADIPLFGDPSVQKAHARIIQAGSAIYIQPAIGAPITVNDQPVSSTYLADGDIIRIGRHRLRFGARAGRLPAPTSGMPEYGDIRQAPPAAPVASAGPSVATAPPATAARLEAIAGPHAGSVFALAPGALIGRDPGCTIPLPLDARVSRRHAQIAEDGAGWRIEDLGSTNGTYANGQRVTSHALASGDRVQVGDTVFAVA